MHTGTKPREEKAPVNPNDVRISMNNSTRLEKAILNGGKVTREGITKRVLVSTPNSGDWYVLTMADGPRRTRTFTSRREDCQTPHVITGEEFTRWAYRLENGVTA
jgi:hypothetical protein